MVVINDRDITELDNLRHALLENLTSSDQRVTDQADADWERLSVSGSSDVPRLWPAS